MISFLFFRVMKQRWNKTDGKIKVLGENPVSVPLCSAQIPIDRLGINPEPQQWDFGD
jgi:hypothetical protein